MFIVALHTNQSIQNLLNKRGTDIMLISLTNILNHLYLGHCSLYKEIEVGHSEDYKQSPCQ